MKFKTVLNNAGNKVVVVEYNNTWKIIKNESNILTLLQKQKSEISKLTLLEYQESEYQETLPFQPAAYRDFMLYEQHAIDAARGFVKKYMSHLFPIITIYQKIFKKPFPKLKPKKRYYKYPIYYMGNHLNFITNNDTVTIPSYTAQLDYELELAAVIIKPLKNASIGEVNNALGGFLILNDFSARDVQLNEINSGFGPMKTKNFGSSISTIIVSKDELINSIDDLNVRVTINGKVIAKSNTKGKLYSFQEAIAYASWEEQLHPGELFGSGTITGCAGIENGVMLNKGDTITLEIEGIGSLTNMIN